MRPQETSSSSTGLDEASQNTRNPRKQKNPKQKRQPEKQQPQKPQKEKPKQHKNVWMSEIQMLQHTTHLLIPRAPFYRLLREILHQFGDPSMRMKAEAAVALQETAELYLTHLMEDAYRCTMHRKAVTLMPSDMELARYMRGRLDPGNL